MRQRLFVLLILLCFETAVFAADEYTVLEDDVNVRTDSTVGSPSLGFLSKEDEVTVLSDKYEWCRVILPERFPSYISAELVEKTADLVRVKRDNVNLRSQPSLEAPVLGNAPQDATFRLVENGNEWVKVSAYPYAQGWVHRKFLRKGSLRKENIARLLEDVMPTLGEPDMHKKKAAHRQLIEQGEDVIELLGPYIAAAPTPALYSIVAVLSEFARSNPALIPQFVARAHDAPLKEQAVYLDTVQNVLAIEGEKIAFVFLAENGELTPALSEEKLRIFGAACRAGVSKSSPEKQ